MGIYYQYANYDDKEVICLSEVTSIKWGCMAHYSLQVSILQCFLGFTWDGRCDFDDWTARWEQRRIVVENDASSHESDDWDEPDNKGHIDAGMAFLSWLHQKGELERVLELWQRPFKGDNARTNFNSDLGYIRLGISDWESYAGLNGVEWLKSR